MRNIDGSLEPVLSLLRGRGLLDEAREPLDRVYQAAAEIARRDGLRALLFRVRGYPWRLAANLIVSRQLLYQLLGVESDREAYTLLEQAASNPGRLERGDFNSWYTPVKGGLEVLPALRFYEDDGGLYVTSAVFIACLEDACNASIHRIMVADDASYAAVRVVPRHLYSMLQRSPEGLPVAVAIGVDPRILLAAASSPPYGFFELGLAASLLGGSLSVCETPRYRLPVPCGASMVVEAVLGPERAPEGPFTDLLQLYDERREEPVLKIDAVYVNKRREPIMHVILPGGVEHMLLMGFPREASVYNAVSRSVPRVRKVRLTPGGGMWLHAVVSIEKLHDGDGKTAGFAALAAHPSVKHVVVVDDDIDPDNPREVEWAIATRLQADRGLVVVPHARGSTLDPSAREGLTTKIIVDATAPLGERKRYRRPRIPGAGRVER
ncbi:MAG: UbiD family decarboxylase [Crenarchaeota archaeon]|nr:UbiD family decarboxylase [Thermoproteota archaeon]